MASPTLYPNGAGGTVGDTLATRSPFWKTNGGNVWYLYSGTGSDAATPRGKERERPLATLAQAVTNAAAGDTIYILEGHAESLAASQALSKAGLILSGEGSGSTRPRFTANGAVRMFDISVVGVQIRNLYFPASTSAPTSRVRCSSTSMLMDGCYFECGANDTNRALEFTTGAGACSVRNTSFVSTATAVTAQPAIGIEVVNAMSDLWLEDVTFDGGSYGWSDYACKGTAALTRPHFNRVYQLNNSDVFMATGTTVGTVVVGAASGSARFQQDA